MLTEISIQTILNAITDFNPKVLNAIRDCIPKQHLMLSENNFQPVPNNVIKSN